jgi:UDP-perosamine 4-acetyltransferase
MKKLIILGSGGHAKVVIDIFLSGSEYEIVGCLATNPKTPEILGIPIIGNDDLLPDLYAQGIDHAFIAIGDNQLRKYLTHQVKKLGFQFPNAISPSATVSSSVKLGTGIAIMAGAVIQTDTFIGDQTIINTLASVDHDGRIANYVHIAPGCHLAGCVSIGEGTFLGLGSNVINDLTIGNWSILGAGTVVVKDIPDFVLAMGVPAQICKAIATNPW